MQHFSYLQDTFTLDKQKIFIIDDNGQQLQFVL